jgi:hypothetical protein
MKFAMSAVLLVTLSALSSQVRAEGNDSTPGPASYVLSNAAVQSMTWDADQVLPNNSMNPTPFYCLNTLRIRTPVGSLVRFNNANVYGTIRLDDCRNARRFLNDFIFNVQSLGVVQTHVVAGTAAGTDHQPATASTVYCDSTELVLFLDWNADNTAARITEYRVLTHAVVCPTAK